MGGVVVDYRKRHRGEGHRRREDSSGEERNGGSSVAKFHQRRIHSERYAVDILEIRGDTLSFVGHTEVAEDRDVVWEDGVDPDASSNTVVDQLDELLVVVGSIRDGTIGRRNSTDISTETVDDSDMAEGDSVISIILLEEGGIATIGAECVETVEDHKNIVVHAIGLEEGESLVVESEGNRQAIGDLFEKRSRLEGRASVAGVDL